MEYTYSFRIYLNDEQKQELAKTFGSCRFIYNLDNACKRYMNGIGGKPKFKKKNGIQLYKTNYTNNNIEVLDNFIKLSKLGKIKAKVYRKVEGNATVKKIWR